MSPQRIACVIAAAVVCWFASDACQAGLISGLVRAVDADSGQVTVETGNGDVKTFTVPSTAEITLDNEQVEFSEVGAGQKISVFTNRRNVVTKVRCTIPEPTVETVTPGGVLSPGERPAWAGIVVDYVTDEMAAEGEKRAAEIPDSDVKERMDSDWLKRMMKGRYPAGTAALVGIATLTTDSVESDVAPGNSDGVLELVQARMDKARTEMDFDITWIMPIDVPFRQSSDEAENAGTTVADDPLTIAAVQGSFGPPQQIVTSLLKDQSGGSVPIAEHHYGHVILITRKGQDQVEWICASRLLWEHDLRMLAESELESLARVNADNIELRDLKGTWEGDFGELTIDDEGQGTIQRTIVAQQGNAFSVTIRNFPVSARKVTGGVLAACDGTESEMYVSLSKENQLLNMSLWEKYTGKMMQLQFRRKAAAE